MKPPIKNYIPKLYPEGSVTQWFGENPELYAFLELDGHNGIDIIAPYGTPIIAPCDMCIKEVKDDPGGYGRHIRGIGNGYEITFGHLSKIEVKLDQNVLEGEEIGKMGNSGFVVSGATPFWKYNPYKGTHLHFGLRKFKQRIGDEQFNMQYSTGLQGTIENYNNGYKGAINPSLTIEEDNSEKIEKMLTIVSLLRHTILLLKKIIKLKK